MKAIILGHTSMLGLALKRKHADKGVPYITAGRSHDSTIHVDLSVQPASNPNLNGHNDIDCIYVLPSSFENDSLPGITTNIRINTAGCTNIIALASATKASSIVYAGSVFSNREYDITQGLSSYGMSKNLAEQLLAWWSARNGVRFASIRFSQLYDDYGLCVRHQPWIGRIVRYGFERKNLFMPASTSVRNFLHVDDAASLMVEASVNSSLHGILNGCAPINNSYADMAETVFQHNDCIGRLRKAARKEPFRPVSIPTNPLLFEMVNQAPKISFDTWVKRIEYLKTWQSFGPMDVHKS
jgi:nucleoside-diphosphate-sugar epimerase